MIIYICTCLYSHTVSYILYMLCTCVFIGGLIVPNSKGQVKLCVEFMIRIWCAKYFGCLEAIGRANWSSIYPKLILWRLWFKLDNVQALKDKLPPECQHFKGSFSMLPKETWAFTPFQISKSVIAWTITITTNTYMFQTNNSQLLHFHRFTGRLFCFRTFPGTHVPLAVILNAKPCWWLWIWPIVPWQADIETEDGLGRWWLEVQKVLYKSFCCVILLMVVALFLFLGCQWLIPGKRHMFSVIQDF